jgi:hypothetical protein
MSTGLLLLTIAYLERSNAVALKAIPGNPDFKVVTWTHWQQDKSPFISKQL